MPRTAKSGTRSTIGPRLLHPGAWWLWALGLAAAASRTTNPLLLLLIIGVAGYVVAARRSDAPWSRSYGAFLKLGLLVLAVRMVFAVLLGSPVPGSHVLFTLPQLPLPDWARGVRIGGPVTLEGLLFAFYDGLKLATLLICVGAANALASPSRLLRSLPGALYEAGVAVVVAMTFAPNLVADVQRLRSARRLRGRTDRGAGRAERRTAGAGGRVGTLRQPGRRDGHPGLRPHRRRPAPGVPGHRGAHPARPARGLLRLLRPARPGGAAWAFPVLLLGLALTGAGLLLGSRRAVRTRYRPDPWAVPEWLVTCSGVAVAALTVWFSGRYPEAFMPSVVPPVVPTLPVLPAAALLIGLLPALVAPEPPRSTQ